MSDVKKEHDDISAIRKYNAKKHKKLKEPKSRKWFRRRFTKILWKRLKVMEEALQTVNPNFSLKEATKIRRE